jgi:Skp family chaperone for outer membrane proteins
VAAQKVGVIDLDDTLSNAAAGKRAGDAFEATRKAKQGVLDKRQEELRRENAELEKQKGTLGAGVFEQRRGELEKKFLELPQTYVKLERGAGGGSHEADRQSPAAGAAED